MGIARRNQPIAIGKSLLSRVGQRRLQQKNDSVCCNQDIGHDRRESDRDRDADRKHDDAAESDIPEKNEPRRTWFPVPKILTSTTGEHCAAVEPAPRTERKSSCRYARS